MKKDSKKTPKRVKTDKGNIIYLAPGCTYIEHVEHYHTDNSQHPTQVNIKTEEATPKNEMSDILPLPAELDTAEGRRLLDIARSQGWLDEHYQPTMKTKEQIALVAARVCKLLFGCNRWSVFETFWGQKNMAQYFQNGLNFPSHLEFNSQVVDAIK